MASPSQGPPPSLPTSPSSPPPLEPVLAGNLALRRWLVRALVALAALVLVLLGALLVLLANLDRSWVKRYVGEFVLASAGLELEYGAVQVGLLSDLSIDDLVVRSPVEVRSAAPELLRIGHIRAHWSTSTLLGAGAPVRDVELESVTLTVVLDEHGRSSLDAIPKAADTGPKPATPLSQLPTELLEASLPVRMIHVSGLALGLVRTEQGKIIESNTLRGLSLEADMEPRAGKARLSLAIGRPAKPLALVLTQRRASGADRSARLLASLDADVTSSHAELALDVRITQQDLAPSLTVEQLLQLAATARFEPAAHQTEVALSTLELGDGAATAEAFLLLPDEGPPLVRHAVGNVDALHLLELAPAGLVPVRMKGGHLHYRVEQLSLDHPQTAKASVDGELAGVELALTEGSASIGDVRISLLAQPGAEGLSVVGHVALDALTAVQPGMALRGDGLRLQLDGLQALSGAITGKLDLHFARLEHTGTRTTTARDGALTLQVRGLQLDPALPLLARGDVTLSGQVVSVEAAGPQPITASMLHLQVDAPLTGGAPFAITSRLALEHLRASAARGQVLVDAPLRLELTLRDMLPNLLAPEHSDGLLHVDLTAGALHWQLDANKRGELLDYKTSADAKQLGQLVPFVPPALATAIPFARIGLSLRSAGRVEHVSAREPQLRHASSLELTSAAYQDIATRRLALTVRSSGTRQRHELKAELALEGLQVGTQALGDEALSLAVKVDRAAPSLQLELSSDRLPRAELSAKVSFDRSQRAVSHDLHARVSGLAPLVPLLSQIPLFAGLDLSAFELRLDAQGRTVGVVDKLDGQGNFSLAPDLVRSAAGQGTTELEVEQLRWSQGDQAVKIPAATWRAKLHTEGAKRTLDTSLQADELDLELGRHRVLVSGLHDQTSVSLTGGLSDGMLEHLQQVSIKSIRQHFAPMYAIADVSAKLALRRDPGGFIKISALQLENRAGGTKFSVEGGLDLSDDRRRLSVRTNLQQDLAKLSNQHEEFVGSGYVSLDVLVASPDFHLFHTRARLELDDASVNLPRQKIALTAMNGEVPILSDWTVGPEGVEFLRGGQVNPYAAQRFVDQHPMLNHRSFVSIARLSTPMISIAPFAANLKLERNIISLSQMELGVRQGTITGNGMFEWDGAESVLEANVRASHVLSSHGEPFDGNAALVMDIRARSIEGRADILRIGKRHLLDLLDLQDPLRIDPSMNQIRSGLRFGYPDRVRLSFKHGFASAGVELGGLARLLKISDIRGIPIGPLMERALDSFEPAEEP